MSPKRCKACRALGKALSRSKTLEACVELHPSFAGLEKAAAGGCGLCQYVRTALVLNSQSFYDLVESRCPVIVKVEPGMGSGIALKFSGRVQRFDVSLVCGSTSVKYLARRERAVTAPLRNMSTNDELGMARQWLSDCMRNHPGCSPSRPLERPSRLLFLGSGEQRVVETPRVKQLTYCALSYCWGEQRHPLCLTRNTEHQVMAGIRLEQLPQTIRDAIVVARSLGVEYLWIDRLCIIQPHKEDNLDWVREAARMCDIYEGAFCTISATSARNSDEGCFLKREWKRYDASACQIVDGVTLSRPLPHPADVANSPISKRGWTLQERYLSSRTLHFTKDALFWHCRTGCRSTEPSEPTEGTLPNLPMLVFKNKEVPWEEHINPISDAYLAALPLTGGLGVAQQWRNIVYDFSNRRLREPRDKLVALSGMANVFQRRLKSQYLAGLWQSFLPWDLLWLYDQPRHSSLSAPSNAYLAPSWSWAKKSSSPFVTWDSTFDGLEPVRGVEVDHKRTFITCATKNPTGGVSGGQITLKAPLIEVRLSSELPQAGTHGAKRYTTITPRSGPGQHAGATLWWDEPRSAVPKTLTCLFLGFRTGTINGFCGLILEALDKKGKAYRRLGAVLLNFETTADDMDGWNPTRLEPFVYRRDTIVLL